MADHASFIPPDKSLKPGECPKMVAQQLSGWKGFQSLITSKEYNKRAIKALCPAVLFTVVWLYIIGFNHHSFHWAASTTPRGNDTHHSSILQSVSEVVGSVQHSYGFKNPSTFTLVEKSADWGPGRARTTGELNVRPGAEEWGAMIWVEVNSYVSDSRLSRCQGGISDDKSLIFDTIANCPGPGDYGNSKAELYLDFTIYIAQDVTLESLNITTDSLNVHFCPGLKLKVSNGITISARGSGSVSMPSPRDYQPTTSLYSRETIIDLSSGSVTGTYPLYDLLSIHTTSGSIAVDLTLHNVSVAAPKPATLVIGSSSGSIRASASSLYANTAIPDRNYMAAVTSSSGSIDVSLVHGTRTFLRSSSGSLVASLYPYGPNTTRSDIVTHTNSGRTYIIVHPALVNATDPLRKFYGNYNYRSGSFALAYPSTWEGTLEGSVSSGSIDIDWDGMQIIEDRKGWVGRKVKGVKGEGEGVLSFHGNSGSASLRGSQGRVLEASKAAEEVCRG